jgi:hypothetical protein
MSFKRLLHEPRNNPNNERNVWSGGSKIDKTFHKLSILGYIIKFIPNSFPSFDVNFKLCSIGVET